MTLLGMTLLGMTLLGMTVSVPVRLAVPPDAGGHGVAVAVNGLGVQDSHSLAEVGAVAAVLLHRIGQPPRMAVKVNIVRFWTAGRSLG